MAADQLVEEMLRGHVPAEDPAARERARAHLGVIIAAERDAVRAHRRTRWVVAGIAAGIAIAVLVLQLVLPPGRGGPISGDAKEIERLGSIASSQLPLTVGSDQYLYQSSRVEGTEGRELIGGTSFDLEVTLKIESWIANDGSGSTRTTYERVGFATPEDRAAWKETGLPIPMEGGTRSERFSPGELPVFDVGQLVSDPVLLRDQIVSGQVIAVGDGPSRLLDAIGTLLSFRNIGADVRLGLFEVAAGIPGVSVEHEASDPRGRAAVAVSVAAPAGGTTLFFDPRDGQLLAKTDLQLGGGIRSRVFLGSVVVNSIGEQPGDQAG